MTNAGDEDVSLVSIGTTALRHRWRIMRWALAGGLVAAIFAFTRPTLYRATASFIPKSNDASSRAGGLANLAGQLGVAITGGNTGLSPDFYEQLLQSRSIFATVARDTFAVAELGGQRIPFSTLFKVPAGSPAQMAQAGANVVRDIVAVSVNKSTGIVEVAVSTPWPSVSAVIAGELITAVNSFNQSTSQGQAAAERKFLEGRLVVARDDLRGAEDQLENFLKANRGYAGSPDLTFAGDRLRRQVSLQQAVFTSLTQSYEDARIRELRDMPVITMIETPEIPTIPEPRKRVIRLIAGILIGGVVGVFLSLLSDIIRRRRAFGDPDVTEFVSVLRETKGDVLGRIRRLGDR